MSTPAIEQSYAVHRQDSTPIDRFWAWFKENTDLLASFEDRGEQVVEEVETYLKAVHEDLTFELGQDDDGTFEFVISADGVRRVFPEVTKLAKCAPAIEGWRVTTFRPRRDLKVAVRFMDQELKGDNIWYAIEYDDEVPVLCLLIDGMTEENSRQMIAASFVLLDMALGEYDVATKFGVIEHYPLPPQPKENGLKPFQMLPSDVDMQFRTVLH